MRSLDEVCRNPGCWHPHSVALYTGYDYYITHFKDEESRHGASKQHTDPTRDYAISIK